MGACFCTGRCRETGRCPNAVPVTPMPSWPPSCDHVFPYWSVIPPSYCPKCGAYLGNPPPVRFPIYSSNTVPNGTTIIVNNTYVSKGDS